MILARHARGLTQTQLANEVQVTQPAVSQWEKGLRQPDAEALRRLADALRVRPVMLTVDNSELTSPMFRAASIRSSKDERKIEARIEHARLAVGRILDEIELQPELAWPTDDDPLPGSPEDAAMAVRRVWRMGSGPVHDLSAYIEAAGAVVLRMDFGHPKVEAAYAHPRRSARRWLLLNSATRDGARANLSLAHELGHAMLHHWDAFNVPDDKGREHEAFQFAIALLVPRRDFLLDLSGLSLRWSTFLNLRPKWGVSAAALARYAHALGLVSKDNYVRLMQERTRLGHRVTEPGAVELPAPRLVSDAISLLRERGDSDREFEAVTGLPMSALADLLPEHFVVQPSAPRLRLV